MECRPLPLSNPLPRTFPRRINASYTEILTVSTTITADQSDRSGISPASFLRNYQSASTSTTDLAYAIEQAVADGVDIINNSWNSTTTAGATVDFSGLNTILRNAFTAGVLVVFSAGDTNTATFSTSCNEGYPGNRPDVLTANGLGTTYTESGGLQPHSVLFPAAWATSACGINSYDPTSHTYTETTDNSVGPDADGVVGLSYFWNSSSSYGYSGNWHGSSFAAPQVAASAALLRTAFYENSLGVRPAYWLKSDLAMLTDGYKFTSYTDGGTSRFTGGVSRYSGTGRLQLRAPAASSFPSGTWSWTWGNGSLSPGQVYTRTISANIQNYRLAFYWKESDLTQAADIDIYIDALDASGAVCQSGFAFQDDTSLLNAIHVKRSDIPSCALPGGSLQIRFVAYGIPTGQTRQIFDSDLWDNESGY